MAIYNLLKSDSVLIQSIASLLTMVIQRLSNTHICIKQFCFQNVLKNSVEFVDFLKKFYIKQATGNIGSVVSSLVFGNIFSTMTRA